MALPIALLGIHLFCHWTCPAEPIPTSRTLLQCMHLTGELLLVNIYFGWHQQELRRYSGAEGVELGLDQAIANVDRIAEADSAAIRKEVSKTEADTRDTTADLKA